MNEATIIVLGATGDLARRKLLPAIYGLVQQNKLERFALVGAALDTITAQEMLERAREFAGDDKETWQRLADVSYYQHLNFTKQDDFNALYDVVKECEKKHKLPGNRLVYLAASSAFFCDITHNLSRAGIVTCGLTGKDGQPQWHRVVYEKPFGTNVQSACAINDCIESCLDEGQVFRIDHYLTNELVGNIALLRFTNIFFEPLWNNRFIDHVQIILSETVCVDDRGIFYEDHGALEDVVQNHMLQLLALIAMESPEKLTGDYIRDRKAAVLKKTRIEEGVLGQYDGYHKEAGVAPDSTVETFALVKAMIDNPRWAGVPFYLKTGKCLDRKATEIHIKFKQVDCLLAHACPTAPNYLIIRVTPDAGFALEVNAKKPGESMAVTPVHLDFCHSCLFGPLTPQAYEVLLEEVLRGEQSVSVRFDEIESAWRIIDGAQKITMPLYHYKKGTDGPKEVKEFEKKHGMRWRV